MKLRHKETGEIIDLPDYLPQEQDAREIARIFQEAAAPATEKQVPPGIMRLKTESGDIISVSKITGTASHFPYDKLMRIHLHLPPFTQVEQNKKSLIWTVSVNGMDWSVGARIYEHVIEKLEWNPASGWWAHTDGIYAIQLEKLSTVGRPKVIDMDLRSWYKKMIAN